MTSYRVRPRFKQLTYLNRQEICERVERHFDYPQPCEVSITSRSIIFKIPLEERHFWSPRLSISLEKHEEGTLLRGLYGPNPTVWTMFMFAYGAIGVAGTFSLLLGLTQVSLDMGYNFIWVSLGLAVAAIVLYVIAQLGQKMGAEQTFTLHHVFESIIHEKVHIE